MSQETSRAAPVATGDTVSRDGIIPTFVIWAAIAIAAIIALMAVTILEWNAVQRGAEERLVNSALDAELDRLGGLSRDYANWDAAIEKLFPVPDLAWADRNVGAYVHDEQSVTVSIVIDDRDRAFLVYVDGKLIDLPDAGMTNQGIAAMVVSARTPTFDPITSVTGFLAVGGRLYAAAATAFTPEVRAEGAAPEPNRPVLVYMRAMESPLLEELGGRSHVAPISVVEGSRDDASMAHLVMTEPTGGKLARLAWWPERPGSDLLVRLIVPIIGLVLLLALVAGAFVRRVQAMTRSLEEGSRELERQNDLLRRRESEALRAKDEAERATAEEARAIEALQARTEDLEIARQEALESSQAKSMFLASMSHELRTPLNSIIGFSEIIRDERFGKAGQDRYVEYAADIWNSGTHLLELINDVLDVARMESGKQRARPVDFELTPLVEQAINLFRENALTSSIRITTDLRVERMTADRQGVLRILINLLSNAIKFTNEGGSIFVRTETAEENGDPAVRLIVSDTGIGIAANDLARVTRPFERVESRYTAGRAGTGLGLALVNSLAELHGGSLRIESEVGVGTTVTVTLPLRPLIGESAND